MKSTEPVIPAPPSTAFTKISKTPIMPLNALWTTSIAASRTMTVVCIQMEQRTGARMILGKERELMCGLRKWESGRLDQRRSAIGRIPRRTMMNRMLIKIEAKDSDFSKHCLQRNLLINFLPSFECASAWNVDYLSLHIHPFHPRSCRIRWSHQPPPFAYRYPSIFPFISSFLLLKGNKSYLCFCVEVHVLILLRIVSRNSSLPFSSTQQRIKWPHQTNLLKRHLRVLLLIKEQAALPKTPKCNHKSNVKPKNQKH